MPVVRTRWFIPATPDQVWAVLTDFAGYAEWNLVNVEMRGQARLGARVFARFRNLAGDAASTVSQTVRIVACDPGRELAWTGAVPLLFKGRHSFVLEPVAGGVRVIQTEVLTGLLPMIWGQARVSRDFIPAYQAVNRALAARVASRR